MAEHKIHLHNGVLQESPSNRKDTNQPFQLSFRPQKGYDLIVPKTNQTKQVLHIHCSFDNKNKTAEGKSPHQNIKNSLVLEEGARLTLIESFELMAGAEVHCRTHVQSRPHSSLDWLNVSQGTPSSFLTCETQGHVEFSASINRLSLTLSEGTSRDFVTMRHIQERAYSVLLGLALLKNKAVQEQKFDTQHIKPEAYSRQYFRGLLNDRARSDFHGRVEVLSEAVQTDCAQSARSFLLSETAQAHTRPEMEIHCGEVKARHGATTGQLNQDEMFYLQSRGLKPTEAFEMLVMAHVQDILRFFPEKQLNKSLMQDLQKNKKNYLNLLTKEKTPL